MHPNTNQDQSQQSLPTPLPSVPVPQQASLQPQQNSQAVVPQAAASATQSVSQVSPAAADDIDVIEKEWVLRAKSIIAKTKDDPNAQSKELGKYKADYIKKRFNKDVKTSEG